MLGWLIAAHYEGANADTQKLMRANGLLPEQADAVPEPYRLLLRCPDRRYWAGGFADQPHTLMLEWDACSAAEADFEQYLANAKAILSDANKPQIPVQKSI